MTDPTDWREAALCQGTPIDWWYPASPKPNYVKARCRCAVCPVIAQCREDVMATETAQRDGFRAGMTPHERASLSDRIVVPRNPRRHGTPTCYSHGCRRPECQEAHRLYQSAYRAERRVG